jgi:homocysteine S-methyltransferase
MLAAARTMVEGVQVSAPFGRYSAAAEVLAAVLPGRAKSDGTGAAAREETRVGQL